MRLLSARNSLLFCRSVTRDLPTAHARRDVATPHALEEVGAEIMNPQMMQAAQSMMSKMSPEDMQRMMEVRKHTIRTTRVALLTCAAAHRGRCRGIWILR